MTAKILTIRITEEQRKQLRIAAINRDMSANALVVKILKDAGVIR